MTTINILCSGPSLEHADPDFTYMTGAVNDAILKSPLCSHWVCIDPPNIVHESCRAHIEAMPAKPVLVTHKKRVGAWEKAGWKDLLGGFDVSIHNLLCTPYKRGSSIWALDWALRQKPERVLVYGMDLEGPNFFRPRKKCYDEARARHRWACEARSVQPYMDLAKERGIHLERVKPAAPTWPMDRSCE